MPEPFQNSYHRRAVAPEATKPCFICYKPTTTVLITPCSKDFFYICPGHLLDRGFAIPEGTAGVAMEKKAQEEAEKKRKEELNQEIEKVKREYEERRRRRKEKGKSKDDKDDEKNKDEDAKETKERDEKIKKLKESDEEKQKGDGSSTGGMTPVSAEADGPRIFSLHKGIYQMRTNRVRQAQIAKRDREAMQRLGGFPAVPSNTPG